MRRLHNFLPAEGCTLRRRRVSFARWRVAWLKRQERAPYSRFCSTNRKNAIAARGRCCRVGRNLPRAVLTSRSLSIGSDPDLGWRIRTGAFD